MFEVFELREVSPSILIKDFHEKSTGRLMIANPAASSIQETFKTFKFFSFIEIAKVKPLSSQKIFLAGRFFLLQKTQLAGAKITCLSSIETYLNKFKSPKFSLKFT